MGERQIGIVGGGNMARAIVHGCLASGGFEAGQWVVAEPDEARRAAMAALGIGVVERAGEFGARLGAEGQILLAVKPQMLEEAARDLGGAASGRVVITILAGTPSARVRDVLGGDAGGCRVVRVMPNMPAQIGHGMAALAVGAGARAGDERVAERVFSSIGRVVRIDEQLMDAFTAVAGSGPAYLFWLGEAMVEAARRVGFGPDEAETIVRATLAGSALLLEGSAQSAADLRRAVTSKGGTTEAALGVLERAGAMESLVEAIVAARDRGRELAGGA